MRLLVVTQYFWPETFIINDLVIHLERLGHEVVVLTGKPNYPDGNVFEGYETKNVQHEKYASSIDVFRVPLRPRKQSHSKDLMLNYLSFVWSGVRYFPKLVQSRDYDAILVFAPSPITSALAAIPLKWKKKAHLAIWVQDLWPQSLAATGRINNPITIKVVSWLVRGIYYFADSLLIQSRAFREPVSRLANDDKIIYYPNSIDLEGSAKNVKEVLPHDLMNLLQSKFCVVFAGNIGEAQAVDTIVQTALALKEHNEIKIVMVGSGSRLDWLYKKQDELGLENLHLAGRFSMSAMPEIFKYASALLVTLKNEAIFSLTIPSKIQAYLAAGKPIIGSLNGEGARIIEESASGFTCEAENAQSLANTIAKIYELDDVSRKEMGNRGLEYFNNNFEMKRQAKNLIKIFEQRIRINKRGN